MSLRVISGSAKGRKLKPVPGDTTRPIMDRVKEALFSILGNYVIDATFFDMFSGTGSVGIEALSRGSSHALFVDAERAAVQVIRENLEHTQLIDRADIMHINAFDLLKRQPQHAYDYVYVAPPQYKGLWLKALHGLDENPSWYHEESIIIVQIDKREREDVAFQNLKVYNERLYGKTVLRFYEHVNAPDDDNTGSDEE